MSDDTKLMPLPEEPDYQKLVAELRAIIDAGHQRVITTINQEQVNTYWLIGQRLVEEEQKGDDRAGYGEHLLKRLGQTLREEYGRGFDETNLRKIRQFFQTYPKRDALRLELTWTHYRILMRIDDHLIRDFYTTLAVSGRWSSRELERQMKSALHLRAGATKDPEKAARAVVTTGTEPPAASDVFKNPYILDFLGLEDTYSEKDFEAAIIRNMERFLLELGDGFCFAGRQKRIPAGNKDYYVDLVFYHRYLRCLVLVDLKIGDLEPADMGQMQFYLEWTKQNNKAPGEDDPFGLILCGSHDEQVVKLMLMSQINRMKVAQYLPLKDIEAIKQHLAKVQKMYEQLQEGTKGADESQTS